MLYTVSANSRLQLTKSFMLHLQQTAISNVSKAWRGHLKRFEGDLMLQLTVTQFYRSSAERSKYLCHCRFLSQTKLNLRFSCLCVIHPTHKLKCIFLIIPRRSPKALNVTSIISKYWKQFEVIRFFFILRDPLTRYSRHSFAVSQIFWNQFLNRNSSRNIHAFDVVQRYVVAVK